MQNAARLCFDALQVQLGALSLVQAHTHIHLPCFCAAQVLPAYVQLESADALQAARKDAGASSGPWHCLHAGCIHASALPAASPS